MEDIFNAFMVLGFGVNAAATLVAVPEILTTPFPAKSALLTVEDVLRRIVVKQLAHSAEICSKY